MLLRTLLQFNLVLGGFFVFFGTNYTSVLLDVLYRKGSTDAPALLSLYCIYVPFLGINGIAEAFFQAVAAPPVLRSQTIYLLVCWLTFIFSSYCLVLVLSLGSNGLVLANMLNLAMRIGFCVVFIDGFFKENSASGHIWNNITGTRVGDTRFWILMVFSWAITRPAIYSASVFGELIHTCCGVICGLVCLYCFYDSEKDGLVPRLVSYYTLLKS